MANENFAKLCLRIPNLGTILFFLVFVIGIPAYLVNTGDSDSLKYYLPFLVMLSVTLTESGKPHMFNNLYPSDPTDLSGFLSSNIINSLASFGLLFQCITLAIQYKSVELGIAVGVITFAITFPIATQLLPYFIEEGDRIVNNFNERSGVSYSGNLHKYLIGFTFIIILLLIEYVLLSLVSGQFIKSPKSMSNNMGLGEGSNLAQILGMGDAKNNNLAQILGMEDAKNNNISRNLVLPESTKGNNNNKNNNKLNNMLESLTNTKNNNNNKANNNTKNNNKNNNKNNTKNTKNNNNNLNKMLEEITTNKNNNKNNNKTNNRNRNNKSV